ncbi:MAG: hypothetical protein JNL71_00055 [Rhodospirillales bacterium]|nr:hypothetical protein [Rhodospirillales bacterium]
MRFGSLLAACLTLAVLPASAQEPARTNDRHLSRKFDAVGPTPAVAPPVREPQRDRPVYLRTAKPLSEIAELDQKASAACRVHDFGQFEQHRGRALVAGRTYGAAAAGSDLLADHPKLAARPPAVYVFEHQGMTACRVWRVKPAALRAAN